MNTIFKDIKLDKNYRIIPYAQDENNSWIYKDDLDRKIDKIIQLKESGKISENAAKRLIKIYLSNYLEDEIGSSMETLLSRSKQNN